MYPQEKRKNGCETAQNIVEKPPHLQSWICYPKSRRYCLMRGYAFCRRLDVSSNYSNIVIHLQVKLTFWWLFTDHSATGFNLYCDAPQCNTCRRADIWPRDDLCDGTQGSLCSVFLHPHWDCSPCCNPRIHSWCKTILFLFQVCSI